MSSQFRAGTGSAWSKEKAEAVRKFLEKQLEDPTLSDGLRQYMEKQLDWIKRGCPARELIPEHIQERMNAEAGA